MKIPATVITGFLGAGKTTLIRHLLENSSGRRIALIINEFGDLGIDRELITGCGIEGCEDDDVLELANGCICCTVADDFLPTMEILLNRPNPPEHIVIETSGLALPKPLVRAFNWPEIRSRVTVDGVITVVDAPAVAAGLFANNPDAVQEQRQADEMLDHDAPLEEVFEDQLASADMILLNKTDLLDADGLAKVRQQITAGIGPAVKIIAADHGAIDPSVLLGISAAAEDVIEERWSHHDGDDDHDHDDFESIVAELDGAQDAGQITARVEAVLALEGVLRIKGTAHIEGRPARLVVQGVGPRVDTYFDRPWNETEMRRTRLVIIGLTGFDQAAAKNILGGG